MIRNAKTASEKAVAKLYDFLELVRDSPRDFVGDKELLSALRRQSRLGAYRNDKHSVTPTSRSTIERVCERLLVGGHVAFDKLRRQALEELTQVARILAEIPVAPRRTRDFYKELANDRQLEVLGALEDCWHLTGAVHTALMAGREVASGCKDPALTEKWRKAEAKVLAELQLAKQLVASVDTDVESWVKTVRRWSSEI